MNERPEAQGVAAKKRRRLEQESLEEGFKLPVFDSSTIVQSRPVGYKNVVGQAANVGDAYVVASYVYASSTRPDLCQPATIIKPKNGNYRDIQLAIKAAYDNKVPIACRSSGHQFGGFCSGNGNTIQIDMADWTSQRWIRGTNKLVVGPGVRLGDMDETMAKRHMFLPHGECSWVCVGGHVQSGGFSVDLPRSFGFFIDYVDQFTIVTAPKDKQSLPPMVTVKQPKKDVTSRENDELWFAIIGGSPGNFGVITQVVVKPILDTPYLDARTRIGAYPFNEESYKICLDFVAGYLADDDLAADFNFSVTVVQGEMRETSKTNSIDLAMSRAHAEIYGRRFGKFPCPIILVMATWANLQGQDRPYAQAPEAQAFFAAFDRMEKAVKKCQSFLQMMIQFGIKLHPMEQLHQSEKTPMRLAEVNTKFSFPARVQANPYLSVTNCMPTQYPRTFNKWFAKLVREAATTKGAYVDNGIVAYGGKHSRCRSSAAPAQTALAHRDRGLLSLYYVHYDNVINAKDVDLPRRQVMANMNKTQRGAYIHMGGDKRWNMFPNQAEVGGDDEHGDNSLDAHRFNYYTDRLTYLRVLRVKRLVDPTDVFTPNEFCVGASRISTREATRAKSGDPALMTMKELEEAIKEAHRNPEWPRIDNPFQ